MCSICPSKSNHNNVRISNFQVGLKMYIIKISFKKYILYNDVISTTRRREHKGRRKEKMEMFAGQPTVMGRKGKDDDLEIDLEAGGVSDRLYPGIGYGENQLRWGFIRKVYGILCAQILLTTLVSSLFVLYPPISTGLQNTPALGLAFAILPFIRKSSRKRSSTFPPLFGPFRFGVFFMNLRFSSSGFLLLCIYVFVLFIPSCTSCNLVLGLMIFIASFLYLFLDQI